MDSCSNRRHVFLSVILATLAMSTVAFTDTGLALIEAVRSGSTERVRTVLQSGVNVNAAQGDGARALHWAAHKDDVAIADLLIRAGAEVNAANDLGATPLWLASLNGSGRMV